MADMEIKEVKLNGKRFFIRSGCKMVPRMR